MQAEQDRPVQLGSEVLLQLRSYAEAFLEGSYNILMGSIRKDLDAGLNISRLSADDFLRFFRLASLFTGFVRRQQACCGRFWLLETKIKMQGASVSVFTFLLRHVQEEQHKERKRHHQRAPKDGAEASPFSCISATMGWETFHLVQSLWLSVIDLPAAAQTASGDKWVLQVGANTWSLHASLSHS